MLKPRGENVAASEIELALEGHPAVVEAAVVGVFDPHHEELVVAVLAGERCDDAELSAHAVSCSPRSRSPPGSSGWRSCRRPRSGNINKGQVKEMVDG